LLNITGPRKIAHASINLKKNKKKIARSTIIEINDSFIITFAVETMHHRKELREP
jgi:hypothetical protein